MFYFDLGSGPPLLLIHGMWGDHLDWEPVLEPLADRHRVIAVDLPGFGRSASDAIEYSAACFVNQLTCLLDQLEIQKVAVAGNSFGGQIALSLALDEPARIEKVILVSTGGLRKFLPEQIENALSQRSEELLAALTPEVNAILCSRLFFAQGSEAQKRYIEKQNAKLLRADYPRYAQFIHRCMRLALQLYLLDRVEALRLPVLFIQGDKDPIIQPQWIREALPRFANARLSEFAGCGHVPQLEQPHRFVEEVEAFLAG